ncbi:redox-regulated ATPase YchF, partial [Candidatus Berkelbacteria bacterium]|nr:redox-regulated ATPase YchF [Candidatus Berkelbacteria bacterium]
SHIRGVDAIVEVVRSFDDQNIIHVAGIVDPEDDISTINTELLLADLEQATKAVKPLEDRVKKQDKEAAGQLNYLNKAIELLNNDIPLRTDKSLCTELKSFNFLTAKPLLYVANVGEKINDNYIEIINSHAQKEGAGLVVLSVKTELEIIDLNEAEQAEFRESLHIKSGLSELIKAGYELLNLQTFFTAGPKEAHAWTITKGTKAPQAAGVIHTDFERGFIRAEVFSVQDLQELGSEKVIREKGKLRSEGKDYVMQDGDVVEFLFNV